MLITKALGFILILLEVLVIFNLIIVVHELGHFLAARWRGAHIEEFGIWFGKPIWRRKFNGVWYSLGSIPAGGFVKLPQLGNKAIEGDAETPDLEPLPPIDKIIVAFAGPLFSLVLAFALATVVWKIGRPSSQEDEETTIGVVKAGSPAELAGIKPGDKILSIDGKPVSRFGGPLNSIMWGIISSEGEKIDFLVRHPNGQEEHLLSGWTKEATTGWRRQSMRKVGMGPLFVPEVGSIVKDGPAVSSGLQKGDVVQTVNGKAIITLDELFDVVRAHPKDAVALTVKRGAETVPASLTPKMLLAADGKEIGPDLGVEWGKVIYRHPSPWEQVHDSVFAIRNMVAAAVSSKSDVKAQHFSGPIGIMNVYKRILESDEGWRMAIVFSVLLNVNLAMLNMLPLPVLDGGHILLGFIQLVRRKPVNGKALEWLETACVILILGYLLYVTSFDISDHFPGAKKPLAVENSTSATPAPVATPAPAPAP